jgi:hypothetical protein
VSLVSEVVIGLGAEPGDAWAINLQPGWFITRQLQLVGRYQLAGSNGEEGLRGQRRYEVPGGLQTGDLYQAVYGGLDYYVAGHRAKLLTGVEYSTLGGEDLWTVFAAVRVFWGPHSRGPFPHRAVARAGLRTHPRPGGLDDCPDLTVGKVGVEGQVTKSTGCPFRPPRLLCASASWREFLRGRQ